MTINAYWSVEEWCAVARQAENLPPVLQAIIALEAWNELIVLIACFPLPRVMGSGVLAAATAGMPVAIPVARPPSSASRRETLMAEGLEVSRIFYPSRWD
ncbi:DUF1612 domain-containing protein [Rhizobium sp. ICMP 5592]|nr:DUF1612 domain-containing protein [Rhizobium sp. ICMP 5592]